MRKAWKTKRLGDVLELLNGYAFDSKAFNPTSGLPLIRIRSLRAGVETETFFKGQYDNKYIVNSGDLLIGMDGEFGCFEWKGVPALLNQRVCRLQGFSGELIPRFLFYGINGYLKAIEDVTGYTTVKHLSSKQILEIEFPIPPLSEQHRIVGLLDEAFEGIAIAKENAKKNLQNARAIFESHLQAVFSQRGEGWVEKKLGDVADLLDCLHKTPSYVETGLPMVRVTDIKPGFLDLSKTRKVDEQTFIAFSKGRTPRAGDIVFSRVGSCGVSALVNSDEPFCLGQNTIFIFPKMNPMLLYHFLNSPDAKAQFEGFIDGTTQPTISMKSIRDVVVSMPPFVIHERLVDNLDSMNQETQRLAAIYQQKLAALEDLKKSLLHQAFAGEL
jgi:type I restriction enzyme, S subunit